MSVFVVQVQRLVEADEEMDDLMKSSIVLYLADADLALVDGADESLQLLGIGSHIIQTMAQAPRH